MTPVNGRTLTARFGRMTRAQLKAVLSDNPVEARIWIYSLATEGLAAAQVLYGSMLLDGKGVAQDQRAAVGWFSKAADQKNSDGFNMLGRCLEHGWGCKLDYEESAKWFQAAAQLRNAWGLYNLGHRYLDGLGLTRDFLKAYRCYHQAAELGHPRAMNLVGRCFEEGWGVSKNVENAGLWYQRSAELGYFRGQFNWASYLMGKGLVEQAIPWLLAASRSMHKGTCEAIFGLLDRHSAIDLQSVRDELHRQGAAAC